MEIARTIYGARHNRAATAVPSAHGASGQRAFRTDIEGLRALAILPILFNHAHVKGFAGGFVGVDVFFVISGFLITGILQRDILAGTYSISGFYRRRVLRIFPALLVALAATTLMAVVAMTPNELVKYAKSALATLFFVSNMYFYSDTGYFAQEAAVRPLLHTWSLAIEEQFYIFWPLIMAACAKFSPSRLRAVVLIIAAVSFALSVYMVGHDMSRAFYLIPFRAWELALGGILALWRGGIRLSLLWRNLIGLAGAAGLLYSIHFYREPIAFPGLNAALPCFCTAALIFAGQDSLVGRILSLAPLRFLGRISYSLYLWHWPIIVYARLWLFLPATMLVIAAEIVLSVIAGWMSYRFVEQPASKRLSLTPVQRLLAGTFVTMLASGAAFAAVVASDGFPGRFSPAQRQIAAVLDRDEQAGYRRGTCFILDAEDQFDPRCLEKNGSGPTIALVGDSLAAHYWPGMEAYAAKRFDLRQATMIGCRPMLYPESDKRACARFFDDVLGNWTAKTRPDALLLSGRWTQDDLPELEGTLAELHKRGQRVIVLGPVPRYDSDLPRLLFFDPDGSDTLARHSIDHDIWSIDSSMRKISEAHGAAYISPLAALCPQRHCRVYAKGKVPLQFDSAHFTAEGSREGVSLLLPEIMRALDRPLRAPHPVAQSPDIRSTYRVGLQHGVNGGYTQ